MRSAADSGLAELTGSSADAPETGTSLSAAELAPFEAIDRIATVEMRRKGQPGGYISTLYDAARGALPVSYEIAVKLAEPLDRVAIVTGVVEATHFPYGETDGPVGAFVLARSLSLAGARPVIYVEDELKAVFGAMSDVSGFTEYELRIVGASELLDDPEFGDHQAAELDAAIAVESLGVNGAGVCHTTSGVAYAGPAGPYGDQLVAAMNGRDKLTIGIGDGGNEIGFGAVREVVRASVPHASFCGCPCGGGTAASTATALLYPVAVSNWGAYAVAAALALVLDNPELVHTPKSEEVLLSAAAAAGCRDGVTLDPLPLQDGVAMEASMGVVGILREIMLQANRSYSRPI
ncbi:MAG: glutamate cyclase domain-containing protein [Dehalococcoidia bacterium]